MRTKGATSDVDARTESDEENEVGEDDAGEGPLKLDIEYDDNDAFGEELGEGELFPISNDDRVDLIYNV